MLCSELPSSGRRLSDAARVRLPQLMLQEQMSGELSPGRRSPTAMSEPEEAVEDHADVLNSMSSLKHAAELLYELYMKTGDDRFFFARTPQRCC